MTAGDSESELLAAEEELLRDEERLIEKEERAFAAAERAAAECAADQLATVREDEEEAAEAAEGEDSSHTPVAGARPRLSAWLSDGSSLATPHSSFLAGKASCGTPLTGRGSARRASWDEQQKREEAEAVSPNSGVVQAC